MAQPLVLERPMPWPLRVVLGCVAVFVGAMPAWEFRHAFTSFGWWWLPFQLIALAAASLGLTMLAAAIAGDAQTWSFERRGATLTKVSPLRRSVQRFARREIVGLDVQARPAMEGDDTFEVLVRLRDGRALACADVNSREAAEGHVVRISAALGLAPE